MANDFSGDSSIKALFKFESSPGLLQDSSGNGNHLTDSNTVNAWDKWAKEGSQCALFLKKNTEYGQRIDADLSAGFPFKNGDATKTATFCFWFRPLSTSYSTTYDIVGKSSTTQRSFHIYCYYNGLRIYWGATATTNETGTVKDYTFVNNKWYHVSVTVDGVNKLCYVRIWDDEAQTIAAEQYFLFTNALYVGTGAFTMGAHSGASYYTDGWLDEVVVFNRVLTIPQLDAIRKGLWTGTGPGTIPANNFSGDSSCKAEYRLESGALTTDSKSSNTLTNHSVTSAAYTYKQGSGSALFVRASSQWMHIADGSLASGFPLKSGETNKVLTIAMWFRFNATTSGQHLIAKRYAAGNKFCFVLYTSSTGINLSFQWGYGSVASAFETYTLGTGLAINTWYHIVLSIDGVGRRLQSRIYNASTGAVTLTENFPSREINIVDSDLTLGASQGATTGTAESLTYFDGYMDEVVIFNKFVNLLEGASIRQGVYTGTHEGAQIFNEGTCVAYRTTNRKDYVCVDPVYGGELNDGRGWDRPWRSLKAYNDGHGQATLRYIAPGAEALVAKSDQTVLACTAWLTVNTRVITTSANLTSNLTARYDWVRFDNDDMLYGLAAVGATSITLFRPYLGSTRAGATVNKIEQYYTISDDTLEWVNPLANDGFSRNLPVYVRGGVNKTSNLQDGFTCFNARAAGYYGLGNSQSYTHWTRFGINNSYANEPYLNGSYNHYELMFFGSIMALDFNSYACEYEQVYVDGNAFILSGVFSARFVDCGAYHYSTTTNYDDLSMGNVFNTTFVNMRTGYGYRSIILTATNKNVLFVNSIFGDGQGAAYCDIGSTVDIDFDGLDFINCKFNSTNLFQTTSLWLGNLGFEHFNQTEGDHRTYIFDRAAPSPTTMPAVAIMHNDTSTFKTSSPSVRLDFNGYDMQVEYRHIVPITTAGSTLNVGVYVRTNPAYLEAYPPQMTVRYPTGAVPSVTWVEETVTADSAHDVWNRISKDIQLSYTGAVEVILTFRTAAASGAGAQAWYDEFEVS